MVQTKGGTFSVAQNPRGTSVAFSSLLMRLWVVAIKVGELLGQHMVAVLVLEVEEMSEVLWTPSPQSANVGR